MRLIELFLNETTEEDRAIISLAQAIFHDVEKHKQEEPEDAPWYEPEDPTYDRDIEDFSDILREKKEPQIIHLGKIGKLYDTPLKILNSVKIDLQDGASLDKRSADVPDEYVERDKSQHTVGVWLPDEKTISLNMDYLNTPKRKARLRSVVAHELRHALDDAKSEYRATSAKRYTSPRRRQFIAKTKDPAAVAREIASRPIELNARFQELENTMVAAIRYAVNNLPEDEAEKYIMKEFDDALDFHQIKEFFPRGVKDRDYRRLINRANDFIEKEYRHQLDVKSGGEIGKAEKEKLARRAELFKRVKKPKK